MESVDRTTRALWTEIRVTVNCGIPEVPDAETAVLEFFHDVRTFENRYSRFLPWSEVWDANSRPWTSTAVSRGFLDMVEKCERIRMETDGYFDMRVEALLSSWGYSSDPKFSVGRETAEDESARSERRREYEFRSERGIDFWGIGKGVLLDMAKIRFGPFENVCVSAGGDLFVKWNHLTGSPFAIALEHPLDPETAIGEIRISEPCFIAGSSANRRSWGKWRGHIADPIARTPACAMLANFTYAGEGWIADAWSTAYFAMGFDRAKTAALSGKGPDCLLISVDGTVFRSPWFPGNTYSQ